MKDKMLQKLSQRLEEGLLRSLPRDHTLHDFSSNDYLSFARSEELKQKIQEELEKYPEQRNGSTGSRLLTGNNKFAEKLEKELAGYHRADNGLIFGSGYNANLALFSAIPQKGDTVICDEFVHASVIDGIRVGHATRRKFKHNDLDDLERQIKQSSGLCFVAVESIYSMDGDIGDLFSIAKICQKHKAHLIVDEAHAFGVCGTGLVDQLNIHNVVFARVVTFGKALGLHGAIVLGADPLRDYLINFARPFIYTTAPPFSYYISVQVAYRYLIDHPQLQHTLRDKATLLKANMPHQAPLHNMTNPTPIQCVFIKGNEEVNRISNQLRAKGFDVAAIRSPTVPKGKERLRITLHCHNSDQQILSLCKTLYELISPNT